MSVLAKVKAELAVLEGRVHELVEPEAAIAAKVKELLKEAVSEVETLESTCEHFFADVARRLDALEAAGAALDKHVVESVGTRLMELDAGAEKLATHISANAYAIERIAKPDASVPIVVPEIIQPKVTPAPDVDHHPV